MTIPPSPLGRQRGRLQAKAHDQDVKAHGRILPEAGCCAQQPAIPDTGRRSLPTGNDRGGGRVWI